MVETRCRLDDSRTRIAVIDDDLIFVELMHDLLAEGEGYDVVSSSHWISSLEFIKAARPDLLILDLMMGREQTGRAILELLHEDPETSNIPVILCSAAAPALREYAEQTVGKRPVEAVAKPFDVDHLLGVIERLLKSRQTDAVA